MRNDELEIKSKIVNGRAVIKFLFDILRKCIYSAVSFYIFMPKDGPDIYDHSPEVKKELRNELIVLGSLGTVAVVAGGLALNSYVTDQKQAERDVLCAEIAEHAPLDSAARVHLVKQHGDTASCDPDLLEHGLISPATMKLCEGTVSGEKIVAAQNEFKTRMAEACAPKPLTNAQPVPLLFDLPEGITLKPGESLFVIPSFTSENSCEGPTDIQFTPGECEDEDGEMNYSSTREGFVTAPNPYQKGSEIHFYWKISGSDAKGGTESTSKAKPAKKGDPFYTLGDSPRGGY